MIFRNNVEEIQFEDLFRVKNYHKSIDNLKYRQKTIERYGRSGVVLVGDREIGERKITINFALNSTGDTEYNLVMNRIYSFFVRNKAPFYIIDGDKRAIIELIQLNNTETAGLEKRLGNIRLQFIMLDSFFEDLNTICINQTLTNRNGFILNNNGSSDSYPKFTVGFKAETTNFKLHNLTNSQVLSISSSNVANPFTPDTIVTIDCNEGIVSLLNKQTGTNQNINSLIESGFGFLSLNVGQNRIGYSGSVEIDLMIEFRRRFAFV